MVVDLAGLKRSQPCTVQHRSHQPGLRIQHIDITGRITHVTVSDISVFSVTCLFVKETGDLGDAPVVIGIFEGLGHRLVLLLGRHHIAHTVVHDAELILVGGLHHGVQKFPGILHVYALGYRIGNHGHRVVSDHAVGLPACQSIRANIGCRVRKVSHSENTV